MAQSKIKWVQIQYGLLTFKKKKFRKSLKLFLWIESFDLYLTFDLY